MRIDVKFNEWHLRNGKEFFCRKLCDGIFLSRGNDTVLIDQEDFEEEFYNMCLNLWENWHDKSGANDE